jgi:hypothetical protein
MPASKIHARAAPPTKGRKNLVVRVRAEVADEVLEVKGVLFTVRVVIAAVEPLMVTDVGILHDAGSLAAVGVIAQVRLITPVNPSDGVRVIEDVFPLAAPGATLTGVPEIEKLACGGTMVYVALDTVLWAVPASLPNAFKVVVEATVIGSK